MCIIIRNESNINDTIGNVEMANAIQTEKVDEIQYVQPPIQVKKSSDKLGPYQSVPL